MTHRQRLAYASQALVLPLALIALWWWLTADSESIYFPPLGDILDRFVEIWFGEGFADDLVPSVLRLVVGYAIAIAIGVGAGIVLGLFARARRDLQPMTEFFRATPVAGLVPLALILLGPTAKMEVALIAFASVWPVLVATADGVRGTDPMRLETARVYGLSRAQQIRTITLPAALPQIFAGLRIGIALAVTVMVFANMFGQASGIGFFVIDTQQSFDVQGTWAGLIMIGLVGCAATLLLVLVQHYVLRWHRGWRASTKQGE